jgi:hypothetical protein
LRTPLLVVLGEPSHRVDGRVAEPAVDRDPEQVLVGAEIVVGEDRWLAREDDGADESLLRLGEALGVRRLTPADARHADRDVVAELSVDPPEPLDERLARGRAQADQSAQRLLAVVEERAR